MTNDLPLFAVIAKSAAGKARLRAGLGALLPATFPGVVPVWHVDPDGRFAMHAPVKDAAGASVLCLRGAPARDTAACLAQLQRTGVQALASLGGGFAAVFWDAERAQIIVARDKMGQQGLFVREDPDLYLVCSELPPLLDDPAYTPRLDVESAVHYLQFGSAGPGRTLARGVTRVPAAHYLCANSAGPLLRHRYFTPLGYDASKVASEQDRRHITATLDDTIERSISAGANALLLSGGVDSSYIAMTAAMRAGPARFDAYTIEFATPFRFNEGDYAKIVADAAGIRHHRVTLDTTQAHVALEAVLAAPEPCSAWASMTHHHLTARIGADGIGSMISGLGADEVFGGYWAFFKAYARQRKFELSWPVGAQVDATDGLMWTPTAARARLFSGIPRFFDDKAVRDGLNAPYSGWNHSAHQVEFYRECRRLKPNAHLFELMVAHECQHRIPELLFAGFEPIARGHGVQTAYPFLDPAVATLACALGATERFWHHEGRWRNKRLLRVIAAERVPEAIMKRPLYSYNAPIVLWLQDVRFAATVRERLRRSNLWETGLIRPEWLAHVEQQVALHLTADNAKRFTYVEQLWAMVTLAAWYTRWIERKA